MFKNWYKKGDALLREIKEAKPAADELYLWYIGQCGFVFKYGDKIIYIDPVLNDLTDESGDSRKFYPSPFSAEDAEADYVICTHAHADHMALPTLKEMSQNLANTDTIYIVPDDCIAPMVDEGIPSPSIMEAKALTPLELPGSIRIYPVSAAHPEHAKTISGGDTALSYMIDFGGIRLLHMGDTYLTDQLYEDLLALPSPHLFLPPINGGDYFRTARNCIGNLSVRESATLAVRLQADCTIPTHYDMVMDNTVDPLDFVRELRYLDTSRKWHLPALGERVIYKL